MLKYLVDRYTKALEDIDFLETEVLFTVTPRMAQKAIRENSTSNIPFYKAVRALLVEIMTGHFEKVAHRPEIEGWASIEDNREFFTCIDELIEWC